MIEQIKNIIDYISSPLISFTALTILFPLIFPPTDFFEKLNKKFGLWKIWTNSGGFFLFVIITAFFILGFNDKNFSIVLTKPDNFPIILMIYSMFFFTWYGMKKSYINDRRIDNI
jgi:fucose 4-O-acetylase-like acetyltransferase